MYVNAAFLRLTGYSWEEVQNRNCRFLQGPQTDPATVAAMRKALAEHRPVRVEILNYRKGGSSFRNLLALKFVTEFASESDAAANRNGVPRYVLGVQFEATSHTMVDARLVDLDAFVAMLPSVYVTPVVTAENVGSRNPSMQFSLQRSSTPQKLPSPRITSATHSFSRRVHSAIALPASAVTADNHAAVSGFELSQAPG